MDNTKINLQPIFSNDLLATGNLIVLVSNSHKINEQYQPCLLKVLCHLLCLTFTNTFVEGITFIFQSRLEDGTILTVFY